MSIDSTQLGALHLLAQRFGDGLKPHLAALLIHDVPQGVARLNPRLKSSGPAEQGLTLAQLTYLNIPQIGPAPQDDVPREGTHD